LTKRRGFEQPHSGKIPVVDEADHLQELLRACHRVLPKLAHHGESNHVTEAIRETCRAIEARLQELGATSSSGQT
jgi:methylphosphotriester-DNA--protein-cysteine methyltransferase